MRYVVAVLAAGLIFGCASKKMSAGYREDDVRRYREIAFVEPDVRVLEIDSKSRVEKDEFAQAIQTVFRDEVSGFVGKTSSTYYGSETLSSRSKALFDSILDAGFSGGKKGDLPKDLVSSDAWPADMREDKVLVARVYGYYKTPALKRAQTMKSIGIGLLTLGFFIPVYTRDETSYRAILLDRRTGAVIFKESIDTDKDPRKPGTAKYFVDKSIRKFFDY